MIVNIWHHWALLRDSRGSVEFVNFRIWIYLILEHFLPEMVIGQYIRSQSNTQTTLLKCMDNLVFPQYLQF